MSKEKTFHAGQAVPQTAMYRVFHYQHRLPHEVMMRKGESFPACNKCSERVSFRISSTAGPLAFDHDFGEKAA